jgi:hypothetical protein
MIHRAIVAVRLVLAMDPTKSSALASRLIPSRGILKTEMELTSLIAVDRHGGRVAAGALGAASTDHTPRNSRKANGQKR